MKLFIFTDGYPFGTGEKSFVGPEVDYLSQFFEVTIVSVTSKEQMSNDEDTSALPDNVSLECVIRKPLLSYIPFILKSFFNSEFYKEVFNILKTKQKIIGRCVDSLKYMAMALSLKRSFEKRGIFRDLDNSVYYSYWFVPYCLSLALEKKKLPKLRYISRAHNYDLYNERSINGRQPYQVFKAVSSEKILFVSPLNRNYFITTFFAERKQGIEKKCEICRLGSFPRVNNSKKEQDVFRVVSCSYLEPIKRVDLIAQSLIEADLPNLEWVHFGSGAEMEKIKTLIKDSNVKTVFYGQVSNDEIIRYYENNYVDVFITASKMEGSPVSIQEALSFGIPIIGTNVGGIPEQIQGNGILLSSNPSVGDIVNALEQIYKAGDSAIEHMREQSLSIWENKYNLQRNLPKLKGVISSVSFCR